jgi:hypothetical protein
MRVVATRSLSIEASASAHPVRLNIKPVFSFSGDLARRGSSVFLPKLPAGEGHWSAPRRRAPASACWDARACVAGQTARVMGAELLRLCLASACP